MIFQAQFLSEEERHDVHQESLRILREVGVQYFSPKALELLKKNGAVVDADSGIAKIPEDMVQAALDSAPKSFTLGARIPEFDFPMPSPYSAFNLDAGGIYHIDFTTGEKRLSTLQDCIDALKVFDDLPLGTIVWPCSTEDVSVPLSTVWGSLDSLKYTSKHLQEELLYPEEVPFLIRRLGVDQNHIGLNRSCYGNGLAVERITDFVPPLRIGELRAVDVRHR